MYYSNKQKSFKHFHIQLENYEIFFSFWTIFRGIVISFYVKKTETIILLEKVFIKKKKKARYKEFEILTYYTVELKEKYIYMNNKSEW